MRVARSAGSKRQRFLASIMAYAVMLHLCRTWYIFLLAQISTLSAFAWKVFYAEKNREPYHAQIAILLGSGGVGAFRSVFIC
jgi:hypothetical protein